MTGAVVHVSAVPRSVPALLLLLATTVIATAACGSSSRGPAPGAREAQFLAYVDCMRGHGVTNLPDPGPDGGIQIGRGSGIDASSPAFASAQAKCVKLLPDGGRGALGPASERARDQLLAVSTCMRGHGIGAFPDPTLGPPPSRLRAFSIAVGRGGVSLILPTTIDVSSPAFRQAAVACHFAALLTGGRRTPAPQ